MPRMYCQAPLASGLSLDLPAGAARHVQVLRLQPGSNITLFNGQGGEFEAQVTEMGRSQVQVLVGAHIAVERERGRAVHIALGMPANERMDWLVEKATELGVASIQPLMTQRTVLRLSGDRALKKQAHWQHIAIAACEQCGGNRVPTVHAVMSLDAWLANLAPLDNFDNLATSAATLSLNTPRLLLSLAPGSLAWGSAVSRISDTTPVIFLSGPEGGFAQAEEASAQGHGFQPVSLGDRVLRAETAALVALTALTV